MAETLCLRVCSHFRQDVETALAGLGEEGVRVQAYPAVCTLRPGRCNLADARETPPPEGSDGALVLLGCDAETRAAPPDPRVHLVKLDHCIHLLAGSDVLEPEIQGGAYLVTAGWLKQWREHLRGMGFDRETAGEFFRECTRELLLLDTGSDAHALGELEALAGYLGLPCRSRYVGLDYLRLFLSGAIAKWRNLAAEAKTQEVLAQANRKVADYAMAFDLLVRLSHITDEEATIAAIQELFAMLFGCTNLVYAQVEEGRVKEIFAAEERPRDRLDLQQAIDALHEGYLIMPSGNGFFLRIDYKDAVLGLILVREIPFPAYRDQYLNLGLAISNLCGLAISNARTFVKLQETEQNLRRERDINSRLFQQVRALADTDPLTELLNRRRFSELAEVEFDRAKRYSNPIAVIMIDIDHFKQVNDTYGHGVGDQVLKAIAERLRAVRVSDLLARYGGEELVALCPETNAQEAERLAERLRLALLERDIETTEGPIPITASLGVATRERGVENLGALVDRADQALYAAKSAGRNCVRVYGRDAAPSEP
ncbi:diguanylate cyclase [Thiocapsa roseopersicina]|uniref:diguanylate cyclase n=1 Tax=Thiocapsa roseopersicina TaxID=1058 RepID=A0A1H2ULF6_THIRO|nr:diguanylate cyclase [Thiocapsa roseopersicina]SDW56965.1 diguanylate cyclase (GGDEF) domain-containing protein [Thiocapsa roseopersicina]